MDTWSSSLRPSKTTRISSKVTFMASPRRKRSLGKTSLSGNSTGSPKKACLDTSNLSSRINAMNRTFVTSRKEAASYGKKLSSLSSAPNPIPLRPSNAKPHTIGKTSSNLRAGLTTRLSRSPSVSQENLRDKLTHLEKKLEKHMQLSNETNAFLQNENKELKSETGLLKQRVDVLEKTSQAYLIATPENSVLRAELDKLRMCLNTKTLEYEVLRNNYDLLNQEHMAMRRLMDVKEAESRMLEELLGIEKEKSKKFDEELDFVTQENGFMRQTMQEYEDQLRSLHKEVVELKGNIRVFARVRPLLQGEFKSCLSIESETSLVVSKLNLKDGLTDRTPFNFDRILDSHATQKEVFNEVQQLIVSALDGFNICVIAYGQTGSGKTYTMQGPPGADFSDPKENRLGVIPRAFNKIFELIDDRKDRGWKFSVHVSLLKIYNETILDLLNKHKECSIKISASDSRKSEILHLENVKSILVTNSFQATRLLQTAKNERKSSNTKSSDPSLRSHLVLRIRIKAQNKTTGVNRESWLNLVDLAGSERVKQSELDGIHLVEAESINASLTQLLTVIMSHGSRAAHIPYRNSKLTHLLSQSLGKASKTLLLVHVSPSQEHVNESLHSLKIAQKVNDVHIG